MPKVIDIIRKRYDVDDAGRSSSYKSGKWKPGMYRNIFFIGARASGKSSLGRIVAERLGRTFVDTDDVVVEKAGKSIAEIVEQDGWEAFRDLESEVLVAVHGEEGLVVATGGGIILREESRELLQKDSATFYLFAEPEVLIARLKADPSEKSRPSLTDKSLEEEVRTVFAERESLYMSTARFMLRAEQSLDELTEDVLEKLALYER